MDPVLPLYEYEKLKTDAHIRLLKLPSGRDEEFSLIQCPANEAPPYIALSYTWGEPVFDSLIKVDGHQLNVTSNLRNALGHIDYYVRRHNRHLWVDAICIDQQNVQERNHQVLQIRSIFEAAEKVLAWIGDAEDDSDLAMQKMLDWKEHYAWWGSVSIDEAYKRLLANKSMFWGPRGSEQRLTWEAIKKLCRREWWSRAWILPEATANIKTHIACGDYLMPWAALNMAFRIAQFLTDDLPEHVFDDIAATAAWRLNRVRNREGSAKELKSNLLERIRTFRHTRCSDPRDKIYAALNLEANTTFKLQPNYSRSVQDVYIDFVRQWMVQYRSTGHGLDFLAYTSPQSVSGIDDESPAWLPDWRRRETCTPFAKFCRVNDEERTVYNSGGSNCESSISGNHLLTKGLIVDTIESVRVPFNPKENQEFLREVRELLPADADKPYPGGRTVREAFLRTITANVKRDLHSVHDASYILGNISRLDDLLVPRKKDDPGWESRKWLNLSILQATRGRTFFRTRNRYMGLAPDGIQEGDHICIFYGGQMVYVLRSNPEGANTYHFMGEAYVDGFMHGQALELEKQGEFSPQTFTLI